MALPTNNNITNGYPPTEKKTTSLKKLDIGANASSIFWSRPFSWEKIVEVEKFVGEKIVYEKVEIPKEVIRKEIVYVPLPTDDNELLKKINQINYKKKLLMI